MLSEKSLRDGFSGIAVLMTLSLSSTGEWEMSLNFGITAGFMVIVFVVFSLSLIKFIACAVLNVVLVFKRQPKPTGPPVFSKEGGGVRVDLASPSSFPQPGQDNP